MSEAIEITAYHRDVVGKANRRLAAEGKIPGVLYGHDRATKALAVNRHDFELLMTHHAAGATIVSIVFDGEKRVTNAVVKDIQYSPVKSNILHIDFQAIRMDEAVHVAVPLHFVGDAAGVKAGGVLTENFHQVNIEAKPKDIPEALEVDVSLLEIGENLHLRDMLVPHGVKVLDDVDEILCSVLPPAVAVEVEVVPAEGAEPELVGEKPAEESEQA